MSASRLKKLNPRKLPAGDEFWAFYVREHGEPLNRKLHFFGTASALLLVVGAVVFAEAWLLAGALFCGYFFAWIGHFFIERNRPATFRAPLQSLLSDFRMFYLTLNGKMGAEIERLRLAQTQEPRD